MSLIERCNGQSASGNACNTVASLTKNFLEFAAMLQMPQKTFWSLQQCCKCLEKLFGVCRNAASTSKNFSAFAETLQVPRKTFRRLQQRCKCPEKLFGVCRNAASASKNFSEFAETLQVLRKKLSGVCNTAASISRDVLAHCESSVEPLCWLCSYVKLTLTRSCFEFIE